MLPTAWRAVDDAAIEQFSRGTNKIKCRNDYTHQNGMKFQHFQNTFRNADDVISCADVTSSSCDTLHPGQHVRSSCSGRIARRTFLKQRLMKREPDQADCLFCATKPQPAMARRSQRLRLSQTIGINRLIKRYYM